MTKTQALWFIEHHTDATDAERIAAAGALHSGCEHLYFPDDVRGPVARAQYAVAMVRAYLACSYETHPEAWIEPDPRKLIYERWTTCDRIADAIGYPRGLVFAAKLWMAVPIEDFLRHDGRVGNLDGRGHFVTGM